MADDGRSSRAGRRTGRLWAAGLAGAAVLAVAGVGIAKWVTDRDVRAPVVTQALMGTGEVRGSGVDGPADLGASRAGGAGGVAGSAPDRTIVVQWRTVAQPKIAALRVAAGKVRTDLVADDTATAAADLAALRTALTAAQALPPAPDAQASIALGDCFYNYDGALTATVAELGMNDPVLLNEALADFQQGDVRVEQVDGRVAALTGGTG
jgi:hypothetical protein